MNLSTRKREILQGLANEDPDLDLVEEGNIVYFGTSGSSKKMVNDLLRCCLIKPVPPYKVGDPYVPYEITSWGRRVLIDPDFEPEVEILKLLKKQS